MISRAVIMAGGLGRRLYPYTAVLPKPLVPIGDRPILELLILQLRGAGVTHVTLATGHMAELVMAFFGSGGKYGIEIDYTLEEKPLGTVGPLGVIDGLDETFLVMNGDVLTDIDFRKLVEHHKRETALVTVATHRKAVKLSLGVIETDLMGHVVGFREKPEFSVDVSMGIYVYEPDIIDRIPASEPMGFDDLMAQMLRDRATIATYPYDGVWYDIGIPEDYGKAIEYYEENRDKFDPGTPEHESRVARATSMRPDLKIVAG
ncbi:MAG: nucleotidyltransferase family protein [Gemmatimonadota bacterium]